MVRQTLTNPSPSARLATPWPGYLAAWLAIACFSCGGGEPRGRPLTIVSQPSSRSVAIGEAATFSVAAESSSGVQYQWYWNGQSIPGAVTSVLTTRPAQVADDGSVFQVIVSDRDGSLTSDKATLTVTSAPRAPSVGDLRFQGVDAAPVRVPQFSSNFLSGRIRLDGLAGTPLLTGTGSCAPPPAGVCSWFFLAASFDHAPSTVSATYSSGSLDSLDADLAAGAGVATSLDLEEANNTYALSRADMTGVSGFDLAHHRAVPIASLADEIQREGATGRVVTAIGHRAGAVEFLAYGWTGAPSVTYETTVRGALPGNAGPVAAAIASDGYIITALGRDAVGGLIFVGTRVAGDTAARPLLVVTDELQVDPLLRQGYAIVGWVYDPDAVTWTWIGQQ